jgi:nucleoside-triphosphatase THEP1
MSFKARKFRKKVETEVRDNDEDDEDVIVLASEKREPSASQFKSKDSKGVSVNKGNEPSILSRRLIIPVTFALLYRSPRRYQSNPI